jgi:hypothetical protein
MAVINKREQGDRTYHEITQLNPFPVDIMNAPQVGSRVYKVGPLYIPGIGTASAYAAGDAFGTQFELIVPLREGTISNVFFLDRDDEGVRKDLILFDRSVTETTDNAAYAVSDDDLRHCIGVITVDFFYNFANNQVGVATPALSYVVPGDSIFIQVVTQGVDNIAVNALPQLTFVIV